jgi:hypothetical protein
MTFVSISIDLCGSTHVKQTIVGLAGSDRAARDRMYREYKRLLYSIERTFYFLVLNDSGLDFQQLSLVKSIGDELWFAYRLDDGDSADNANRARLLLTALLYLISHDRPLALSPTDGESPDSAATFDLPIKVYADVISDCEELNRERYEHLKEAVAAINGFSSTVIEIDQAYLQACERLNLGMPMQGDGRLMPAAREDFIGLEIDRFFRLARQCHPRLLTVGQALFDLTGCTLAPAARDYEHLDLKRVDLAIQDDVLGAEIAESTSEPVFAIRKLVPSSEMKGISDDYAVFHLFDLPSLGDYFAAPSPMVEAMMGETRGYLAEKGLFAILARVRSGL